MVLKKYISPEIEIDLLIEEETIYTSGPSDNGVDKDNKWGDISWF